MLNNFESISMRFVNNYSEDFEKIFRNLKKNLSYKK